MRGKNTTYCKLSNFKANFLLYQICKSIALYYKKLGMSFLRNCKKITRLQLSKRAIPILEQNTVVTTTCLPG